jgi:phage replication initiation protein
MEKGLTACVDWLQVTFKTVQNPYDVIDLLSLEPGDFIFFENGKYGFPYHLRFGHIAIYYSDELEFVHLEITGQGCREYEQYKVTDWSVFLGLILMLDVNITRLDLAIDDTKGYFSFRTIKSKIKTEQVRSKFKTAKVVEEFQLSDGSNLGTTCYFGSPQSMIQVRIYDKLKERLNKNKSVDSSIDKWIRTEIQLRDERAYIAAKVISESPDSMLGTHIQGILKRYMNFVDKDKNDSNRSRWPVSKFWEKFLGDVEELPLTMIAPEASIQKTKDWISNSVVASFETLLDANNYNVDLIIDMIQSGSLKRKKKHENMLARYRKEKQIDGDIITDKRNDLLQKLITLKNNNKKDSHLSRNDENKSL